MPSPWSTVTNQPSEKPVFIPSRANGEYVTHADLIAQNIPETSPKHWYYNKYYIGTGDSQTVLASSNYEREYPVWYGRRYFKVYDGAQISVDYALEFTNRKPEHWDEDVTYIPDPETPRLPNRTRISRPEESQALDDPNTTRPSFIHVHGLTGGSHENYSRAAMTELQQSAPDAVEVAVITSRGCNRSKITTPQSFNGGWTDDSRFLVKHVTETQPKRPIFLAGYSLGGSILANYLGQEGRDVAKAIKAAVIVSNPWDLLVCHIAITATFLGRKVYQPQMAQNLMRSMKNNRKVMETSPTYRNQIAKKIPIKTVYDFDNVFTGPLYGFDGANDYYRSVSSVNSLRDISVPTLILAAQDDPICSDSCVPYVEAKKNPYTHLVTTTHGGHLGWFQQDGKRWYATVLAKYVNAFSTQVKLDADIPAPPQKKRWFRDHRFQPRETVDNDE